MTRSKKQQPKVNFDIVIADYKDTEHLLQQLRTALKSRGIKLQAWDLGTDDWIISIANQRVTKKQFEAELDWMPEEIRDADEMDL